MPKGVANSNFASLSGVSPHTGRDERYQAYRRAWMDNPATHTLGTFPLHLDVEASSRCNISCVFCDKRGFAQAGFDEGDMDMGLYREILDEAQRHGLAGLKLSYRGEPLMHPRLPEMVALAKQSGLLDVYFNTNGMLLDTRMSEALIESGLDRISISIEGTDKAAFEKARRGADFERIKSNIAGLKRIRDSKGSGTPSIRVQTVRLPGLDLEAYAAYWLPFCDETAAVDYKIVRSRRDTPVNPDWACPQLWQRLTIDWQGYILACNNVDQRAAPLGRVPDLSVAKAWGHDVLKMARSLHEQGMSHEVAMCGQCPWRAAQIVKKGAP